MVYNQMIKLKQFLKHNSIRQIVLAQKIGLCPTILNKVLNGNKKLPFKYYPKLADELKMTIAELQKSLS